MEQASIIKELVEASERLLHIKLDTEDINRILAISQIRIYQKGSTILGINEKLTYTGLVLKGIIRSYYLDMNGKEITKNFYREHFLFMDEGLIGYKQSISAYEAIEDTVVMLFDTGKLKELFMESEKFKDLYIAALETGMRYKIYRENEFLTNNATERYLQFINDYPELAGRVKQSYISTYLGITPESLSRIRKNIKRSACWEGSTYE